MPLLPPVMLRLFYCAFLFFFFFLNKPPPPKFSPLPPPAPLPFPDIKNFRSFKRPYPAARVIRLEQNSRSTRAILDGAGAAVTPNPSPKGKTPAPAASRIACVER